MILLPQAMSSSSGLPFELLIRMPDQGSSTPPTRGSAASRYFQPLAGLAISEPPSPTGIPPKIQNSGHLYNHAWHADESSIPLATSNSFAGSNRREIRLPVFPDTTSSDR